MSPWWGRQSPGCTPGLLKWVRGPPTLLGPELLRTLDPYCGVVSAARGAGRVSRGLDVLEGKAVEDLSQLHKVGPALGMWEGWDFGSGRLDMGQGAPAFASWVQWAGGGGLRWSWLWP